MVLLSLFIFIFTIATPIESAKIADSDTTTLVDSLEHSFLFESSDVKFSSSSTGIKDYSVNFLLPGNAFRETSQLRNITYRSVDFIAVSSLIYFAIKRSFLVRDARSFAGKHAGIYPNNNIDFLYDMSEYMSLTTVGEDRGYNDIVLLQANVSGDGDKNFFLDKMYNETDQYYWKWDTKDNFNIYKGIISDHKKSSNYMYAFLGVLFLNRVVSSIDLYIDSRISLRYSGNSESINLSVVVEK